jgi:hypothetical protein
MVWRSATLGRTARVDDPDVPVTFELRHVRVAVDDRVAVRESAAESLLAPDKRTSVVHEADPDALDLDDPSRGQRRLKRDVVHVPRDRIDRRECGQIVEHARCDQVATVQHVVGRLERFEAGSRELSRPARQVRIGDDGDERQS